MSSVLDQAFQRAVSPGAERLLTGVALAAAGSGMKDGQSQQQDDFSATYGTLQLDPASPPVSTKTTFWMASCTKFVATVAALQCVERGLFGLDSSADVVRILPEWSNPQILTGIEDERPVLQNAKEKITLRQLLNHTSGLTYDFLHPPLFTWRRSQGQGPAKMHSRPVEKAFATPLIFEPGTGMAYGPGLDLAGLMVARANNCTLEEYMRKNIFDVVGMDDSSFYPLKYKDLAERVMPMSTRPSPDEPLVDGFPSAAVVKGFPLEPGDCFGGSGLFSTAEDYCKMLKSVLRNDGRLLKSESINLMFMSSLSASSQAALNETLSDPNMARAMIPGEPPIGTSGAGEWTHSTGGLLGLTSKEDGLKAPWLQWGGAPNHRWWIDREGGSCGVLCTHLSPPGEYKHQPLAHLFRREMAKKYAKGSA